MSLAVGFAESVGRGVVGAFGSLSASAFNSRCLFMLNKVSWLVAPFRALSSAEFALQFLVKSQQDLLISNAL